MNPIPFDTLKFSRILRDKAHFSQEQSEVLSEAFATATSEQLVTKDYFDKKIDALDAKFDKKIDVLDKKIDGLEVKLDKKIDALEAKFDKKIDSLDKKIDTLDSKFDKKIDSLEDKIGVKISEMRVETYKLILAQSFIIIGAMATLLKLMGH